MRKISIDTWIQLLGMVGVLGGLVFVGLEMQQSQLIAIGAQQQGRAELRAQILIAPFEGNIDAARVAFLDWEEMTDDQKLARGMLQQYRWNAVENNFLQNNLGLLSADTWEQTKEYIRDRKSECHLRDFMPAIMNPAFAEFLETLPDECSE